MMLAEFDIVRSDDIVHYDVWYSAVNDQALDFFQDFKSIDRNFGNKVRMSPHFILWYCEDCDQMFKDMHCFRDGQYCAISSTFLTGQEIILEDLRQMCIYEQAYQTTDHRQLFWDYIIRMHDECESNLNEDCSENAHNLLPGLSWNRTKACIKDSFNGLDEADWTNALAENWRIEADLDYWQKYGSSINPSIVINNATYRGQMENQAVMNAICAGFNHPPTICTSILSDYMLEDDLEVGIIYFDDGFKHHHMIMMMFGSMFCVCIGLCLWRRQQKRVMKVTMDRQIQEAVNHYVALSNTDADSQDVQRASIVSDKA